jgi:hypothetical protein
LLLVLGAAFLLGSDAPKYSYDDFESPDDCGACHEQIHQEWSESMMAHSFTHEWDAIEYFKLALPHSEKEPKVAGVKEGCIGCHGPLAFLTGDIPPQPPEKGTRVNEGVSCEICHNITGSKEPVPFNFSFTIEPGEVKQGPRKDAESEYHQSAYSSFTVSPELCATCHDEQSPYGAWVKSTYREWKAGPYAKEGTRCQDCHMHRYPGASALGAKERPDIAHHVFHGSHSPGKLRGAIDLALYLEDDTVAKGKEARLKVHLFNGKAGHYIPSGSSEERMLWLEVTVTDAKGHQYPLSVTPKGFKDEEFTIADPDALAYQAMGEIMEIADFKGVKRDGDVPAGSRIFRKPFFDPKGRMTICQWYTENNTRVDYRIGPRETKIEDYRWAVPDDVTPGEARITARLYYSQVPSSVGRFMKLPAFEYTPLLVNENVIELQIK